MDTYNGRLELRGNVTLDGDLFELQGALQLTGPPSLMQFLALVIDDLGQAVFPGNAGEVENSGLLQVARSSGALISGNYSQAGEGDRISSRLHKQVESILRTSSTDLRLKVRLNWPEV